MARWDSIVRREAAESYVRAAIATTYTDWWRRRWNGEVATGDLPDTAPAGAGEAAGVEVRRDVLAALDLLPRGQRAVARLPRNHGHNVTCLAAITPDGSAEPLVFEEALDGPLFAQWLTERLLPALGPGHVLVLDNLSVHKNAAARAAVEAAGGRGGRRSRRPAARSASCRRIRLTSTRSN